MPCNWEELSESYSDDKFSNDLYYLNDPKETNGIFATDSERDAMKYIIDETNHFMLSVYDKDRSTLTTFFTKHPMGSDYLLSDTFARKYSNSIYTFIEHVTGGVINKDDIGGVIVYAED